MDKSIAEHKAKIQETCEQIRKTTSPYRKRDLQKYLWRLMKELKECEMYMKNA